MAMVTDGTRINGVVFRIYLIETSTMTAIPTEKSVILNMTNNMIECSDKSVNWQQFIDGQRGWTTSTEVNYVNDADDVTQKLIDRWLAPNGDTLTPVILGKNDAADDIAFAGYARVGNISISSNNNELVTCSFDLTGSGELKKLTRGASGFDLSDFTA